MAIMSRLAVATLFVAAGVVQVNGDLTSGRANKGSSKSSCTKGESGSCSQQHQGRTLLQHAAGVADQSGFHNVLASEGEASLGPGAEHYSQQKEPLRMAEVGAVTSAGGAPAGGIKDYINSQLLPSEEQTQVELQSEMSRAFDAFEGCNVDLAGTQESFRLQEQTLMTAEQRHSECEMKVELGNRTEQELCGAYESYAAKLSPPLDMSEVNTTDISAIVDALGTLNNYFTDVHKNFQEKKMKCEVSKSQEEVTKEQCDADKRNIEASWCSLKAERSQACTAFDSCFSSKSKKFDEVKKYVQEGEEISKANFKTLACHGDKDCTNAESDTSHLSVSYPSKPAKMECDSSLKTNWDYADVACDGEMSQTGETTAPETAPEH